MRGDINIISVFLFILLVLALRGKMDFIKTLLEILLILSLYFVIAFFFPQFRIPYLYDGLAFLLTNLIKLLNKLKEGLLQWVLLQ